VIFSLGVLIIFDTLDRIIHRLVTTPDYIIDLGQIMQPDSTAGYIFLFLAVVIMAPIGEEIVFRGFLQKFLEQHWKDITRAVLVLAYYLQ
jgi:membrane protease YdiL (CAAX protease family)